MTKRVERPKTAPNACLPKSELYSATLLPDGDLLVLVRHVFLNVCGDNEDLPDDASRQVKHLAGKLLSVYQENEDKYLKRCEQNFKNRTGEDTDGDSKETEQPTNDRRTSDERPRNKNKSNQDKSNQINNYLPQSIPQSRGSRLDADRLIEMSDRLGLKDACDQQFITQFLADVHSKDGKWYDSKGAEIQKPDKYLMTSIINYLYGNESDYIQDYNTHKDREGTERLLKLSKVLVEQVPVVAQKRRIEENIKKLENRLAELDVEENGYNQPKNQNQPHSKSEDEQPF